MDNKQIAERFLQWSNEHYNEQKKKFTAYCFNKKQQFSEDIFHSTILKIYDKIIRDGLKDPTDKGFENYLFLSYKTNFNREKQYARNTHRDRNVEDVETLYERFYNDYNISSAEKVTNDLRKDFQALYLLTKVNDEFGSELCHLFQKRYFSKMTYEEIKNSTDIPMSRQKILMIRDWLRKNVTKEEVEEKFDEFLNLHKI